MYAKDDPIKILIADDLQLLREGLVCVFSKFQRFRVVGEVSRGPELLDGVRQHRPDILVLDMAMRGLNGAEAVRHLSSLFKALRIITLWKHKNVPGVLSLMEAGAVGFLLKNTGKEELLQAIRVVLEEGQYIARELGDGSVQDWKRAASRLRTLPVVPKLSRREREVIELMCQEYSSKQIAAVLNINSRSVESYRERIQKKVGAKNMIGIVLYAIKSGLYQID